MCGVDVEDEIAREVGDVIVERNGELEPDHGCFGGPSVSHGAGPGGRACGLGRTHAAASPRE